MSGAFSLISCTYGLSRISLHMEKDDGEFAFRAGVARRFLLIDLILDDKVGHNMQITRCNWVEYTTLAKV